MDKQIDLVEYARSLVGIKPEDKIKLYGSRIEVGSSIQKVIETRRRERSEKMTDHRLVADISDAEEIPGGEPWAFELVMDGSLVGMGYARLISAHNNTAIFDLWIEVE